MLLSPYDEYLRTFYEYIGLESYHDTYPCQTLASDYKFLLLVTRFIRCNELK